MNTMAAIDLCILKELYCSNLVITHIWYCCLHHNNTQSNLCVYSSFMMTASRMLKPPLHTSNLSLNFYRIDILLFLLLVSCGIKQAGCAEYYRYATAWFILSMLSQAYNIFIDCVVRAPGHDTEFIYSLNAIDKKFLFPLIDPVKLPGSK